MQFNNSEQSMLNLISTAVIREFLMWLETEHNYRLANFDRNGINSQPDSTEIVLLISTFLHHSQISIEHR